MNKICSFNSLSFESHSFGKIQTNSNYLLKIEFISIINSTNSNLNKNFELNSGNQNFYFNNISNNNLKTLPSIIFNFPTYLNSKYNNINNNYANDHTILWFDGTNNKGYFENSNLINNTEFNRGIFYHHIHGNFLGNYLILINNYKVLFYYCLIDSVTFQIQNSFISHSNTLIRGDCGNNPYIISNNNLLNNFNNFTLYLCNFNIHLSNLKINYQKNLINFLFYYIYII